MRGVTGETEKADEDGKKRGKEVWRTLSIVVAGSEDVDRTRDNELTDVSPELVGSTALNDC
jgi:hypothetical protein